MIGKYANMGDTIRELPQLNENESSFKKLSDTNNASYIDNFFCYLSSKTLHAYQFVNSIDYYGSCLGIQSKYKMNVSDDIEYLNTSDYFNAHKNKLFSISCATDYSDFMDVGSRGNRHRLCIEDTQLDDLLYTLDTLDTVDTSNTSNTLSVTEELDTSNLEELVYEKTTNNSRTSDISSSTNTSNNSETNYTTDSEIEEEEEEEEDEDDSEYETCSDESESSAYESTHNDIYAFISDFPVQLICLEKCTGTLDELFVRNEIDEESGASALFQIIMTLIAYQKMFQFTHNDLHTNNVMYVNTDTEFLYYQFENETYKVPTYGKIYKIIDFGRSIYTFHGKQFCSDSFAPGGDASTQYNCEPYFNETRPRLEPNYSFDLSRLGSSIYDFIIRDEKMEYSKMTELQRTIARWCMDDNGKNILYKRDGEERYPNFKLYKMIARTVHNHTPQQQLVFSFFSQFKVAGVDLSENIMDIDAMLA